MKKIIAAIIVGVFSVGSVYAAEAKKEEKKVEKAEKKVEKKAEAKK